LICQKDCFIYFSKIYFTLLKSKPSMFGLLKHAYSTRPEYSKHTKMLAVISMVEYNKRHVDMLRSGF
jgi:hypothetical protein